MARYQIPVLIACLVAASPVVATPAPPSARVVVPQGYPAVAFAAGEIRAALRETGTPVADQGSSAGPSIVLQAPGGSGKPESFQVEVSGERERRSVRVRGSDERGVMYGALDVAEQTRLGGGLQAVRPRRGSPFLAVRALKFNPPLAGTGYLSQEDQKNGAWFYDLEYWRRFLRAMAYDRYNALTLWSAHPYDRLVRLRKYPEASDLSAEEMRRSMAFFHALFHMARERGIDTYIVTWNIHTSKAFQRAHNVKDGQDSPLVRDYQKECVRELLREYPDLTGLGTCPGENMGGTADWREEWIRDVYLRGIAESGRKVPFIHRYWGAEPAALARMLTAARYPAPMLLDIKFNGEHMYSSPRPHLKETRWLTPGASDAPSGRPRPYRLLWHLRNDCIFQLRWCDPEFARETVRHCGLSPGASDAPGDSAGFVMGSEIEIPGVDRIHTPEAASHKTWSDEFEKNWMRFAVWGRMGYDPDEPDALWMARFGQRFGAGAGRDAFLALQSASKIVPLATSFHWNYMNGDWYPEGNVGSWNTSAEMPFANYRDRGMFHNIRDWILNHTIDASLQSIPDFVADQLAGRAAPKGTLAPPQVAARFEAAARAAQEHAAEAAKQVTAGRGEWECTQADLRALAALGRYYAAKVRAGTELMFFLATGEEGRREAAVAHLQTALGYWKTLAEVTRAHYLPHEVWLFGQFDWARYLPEVEKDIAIAREMKPWAREEQEWRWDSGQTTRAVLGWRAVEWKGAERWVGAFNACARAARVGPPAGRSGERAAATTIVPSEVGGLAVLRLSAPGAGAVSANGAALPLPRAGQVCMVPLRAGGNPVRVEYRQAPTAAPVLEWEMLPGGPGAILLEAESGTLRRPMRAAPNPQALGGRVMVLPKGFGRGQAPDGRILENGLATYRVRLPRGGSYALWGRVWWPDTSANSFFYAWDADKPRIFGNDEEFMRWHWIHTPAQKLGAGEHVLTIRNRDEGSIVDCFAVAPDAGSEQ